jgi:hypothetical protein
MITAQDWTHIPKDGRKNCDVMIANEEEDDDRIKSMRKEKFTNFKTDAEFKSAMSDCCEGWGSICWVGSRIPKDKENPFNNIFSYTASPESVLPFKMNTRIPDIIDKLFLRSEEQLKEIIQQRMADMIKERLGLDFGKPANEEDDSDGEDCEDSDSDDSDDDDAMPAAVSRTPNPSEDERVKSEGESEGSVKGGRRISRAASTVTRGRGGVLRFTKR